MWLILSSWYVHSLSFLVYQLPGNVVYFVWFGKGGAIMAVTQGALALGDAAPSDFSGCFGVPALSIPLPPSLRSILATED